MLPYRFSKNRLLIVLTISQFCFIYLMFPLESSKKQNFPDCNLADLYVSEFFTDPRHSKLYSQIVLDLQIYSETAKWMTVKRTEIPDNMTFYSAYNRFRLKLPILRNVSQIDPTLGPVVNDVFSARFLMNHEESCAESKKLVFMVNSASSNFERRRVIRKTWAKAIHENPNIRARILFLLGSSEDEAVQSLVDLENREHGDIVQVDIPENYEKLTRKSVALLQWAFTFCSTAEFIVKIDDDVYVNVHSFASVAKRLNNTNYLYGKAISNDKPHRIKSNKYYVSPKLWPWKRYPRYLLGGVYIIGWQTVAPLLAAVQTTPFFPLEDVYLTGICAERANVTRLSADRLYDLVYPKSLDACFVRSTVMWQTQTPRHMQQSHIAVNGTYFQKKKCIRKCNVLGICTR